METVPYLGLMEVLGIELEREPYTPIADSLWMCDYERIKDHGAYKDVIDNLLLVKPMMVLWLVQELVKSIKENLELIFN